MNAWSGILTRPLWLMALPLLVIGMLGVYVVETDYALLRTRQGEAAQGVMRAVEAQAQSAVVRMADQVVAGIVVDKDPGQTLRSALLNRQIAFATLYRGEQRQFPPEDPGKMLVSEREQLALTAGAFTAARTQLATQAQAWGWLALRPEGGLVHCRRGPQLNELCVLFSMEQLRLSLATALAPGGDQASDWSLALYDPNGDRIWSQGETMQAAAVLPLAGPLHGWQARAALNPGGAVDRPPALIMAALILPLLGLWFSLAWQAVRRQRQRLAETRHRAAIAAQLSHELRTPLANLKLYVELLKQRADDVGAVRRYCDVLDSEADRLSRLADNATAFAKGEAAPGGMLEEAVPDALIAGLVERLRPLCARRDCRLMLESGASLLCRLDASSLEQILTNLIDNACKYAPAGVVEVSSAIQPMRGELRLCLQVRDHGPGVPDALKEQIFDPMVRGSVEAPGFGLGLAAVRRLARSQGGDVWVEDAQPGACFRVWIPVEMITEEKTCVS